VGLGGERSGCHNTASRKHLANLKIKFPFARSFVRHFQALGRCFSRLHAAQRGVVALTTAYLFQPLSLLLRIFKEG
jgi:hypothetical protein